MIDYQVGDVIEYVNFLGGRVKVLVSLREDDVKNGRMGFQGLEVDAQSRVTPTAVWGYDSQISKKIAA